MVVHPNAYENLPVEVVGVKGDGTIRHISKLLNQRLNDDGIRERMILQETMPEGYVGSIPGVVVLTLADWNALNYKLAQYEIEQ